MIMDMLVPLSALFHFGAMHIIIREEGGNKCKNKSYLSRERMKDDALFHCHSTISVGV